MNEPTNDNRLREIMNNSFPGGEPSDQLEERVSRLAATPPARPARPLLLRPAKAALALALFLAVGGAAYKIFFQRTGEQAIQLIPSNAYLVVTLDTAPSPSQIGLWQRIQGALDREGVKKQIGNVVHSLPDRAWPEFEEGIDKSIAVAVIDPKCCDVKGNGGTVVFLSIKDEAKVTDVLKRELQPVVVQRMNGYRTKDGSFFVALIGGYVVGATEPTLLQLVKLVDEGKLNSVAQLPEYQQARKALPEDANLMLFVSPSGLDLIQDEGKKHGAKPMRGIPWMALSATLRDDGIAIDYKAPVNPRSNPEYGEFAAAPELPAEGFRRLPEGPYGMMAISQPSRFWKLVDGAVKEDPRGRKELEDGLAQFEKETGISVPRDILPALNGSLWLAVYPTGTAGKSSIDGLLVIDDSNGANPAPLAEKLRAYASRELKDQYGRHAQFLETDRNGVQQWTLDPSFFPTKPSKYRRPGQGKGPTINFEYGGVPDGKSFFQAQIGNSILISSSQEMLDRAVRAFKGEGLSLDTDAAYTKMRGRLPAGAQEALFVSIPAILERFRPQIEKALDKTDGISVDDIVKVCGALDNGLAAGGHYDGASEMGVFFIPLDYERVIHIASTGLKSLDEMEKKPEITGLPVRNMVAESTR